MCSFWNLALLTFSLAPGWTFCLRMRILFLFTSGRNVSDSLPSRSRLFSFYQSGSLFIKGKTNVEFLRLFATDT